MINPTDCLGVLSSFKLLWGIEVRGVENGTGASVPFVQWVVQLNNPIIRQLDILEVEALDLHPVLLQIGESQSAATKYAPELFITEPVLLLFPSRYLTSQCMREILEQQTYFVEVGTEPRVSLRFEMTKLDEMIID